MMDFKCNGSNKLCDKCLVTPYNISASRSVPLACSVFLARLISASSQTTLAHMDIFRKNACFVAYLICKIGV